MLLESFFLFALCGGAGIACMTAPLGCVVVWQRMNYFGDAMAHATLLATVFAIWLQIPLTIGVLLCNMVFAGLVYGLQRTPQFSTEGLVGLLSHSFLAIALLLIAAFPERYGTATEAMFGDILAVTPSDLFWMAGVVACVYLWLFFRWKPLLLHCIQEDLPVDFGVSSERLKLEFFLLLSVVIALAIKMVGIFLMAALLITPPHVARVFAKHPETMVRYSILCSLCGIFLGLLASAYADVPAGPAVIVANLALFCSGFMLQKLWTLLIFKIMLVPNLREDAMTTLTIGEPAPHFSCISDTGEMVDSKQLLGKHIVLYFYPKDDTPGCTLEARDFGTMHDAFTTHNTVLLGVSKDSIESHMRFKEKHCLPFALLSDSDGSVCTAYECWVQKSMFGKKYMGIERSTFLIDQAGILRRIWRNVSVTNHAAEVLAAVKTL